MKYIINAENNPREPLHHKSTLKYFLLQNHNSNNVIVFCDLSKRHV